LGCFAGRKNADKRAKASLPGTKQKFHFERAEEKKATTIQNISMNIDDGEKNPQMDEAYFIVGQKPDTHDQRFVPALEAFNYTKYPTVINL
jgi:hypothetical protein